jgi:hypothetical protein
MLYEDGTTWNSTGAVKVAFRAAASSRIASRAFLARRHGNATTDTSLRVGPLPKADTYIIGPNAGVDTHSPCRTVR